MRYFPGQLQVSFFVSSAMVVESTQYHFQAYTSHSFRCWHDGSNLRLSSLSFLGPFVEMDEIMADASEHKRRRAQQPAQAPVGVRSKSTRTHGFGKRTRCRAYHSSIEMRKRTSAEGGKAKMPHKTNVYSIDWMTS